MLILVSNSSSILAVFRVASHDNDGSVTKINGSSLNLARIFFAKLFTPSCYIIFTLALFLTILTFQVMLTFLITNFVRKIIKFHTINKSCRISFVVCYIYFFFKSFFS